MIRRALLVLAVLAVALPSMAGWVTAPDTLTWFASGDIAIVQEARDAVLWERDRHAFLGALTVAAMPNVSVQDNGDGTGTIRMELSRAPAEAWLQAWAIDNGHCGDSPTPAEVLTCADRGIRQELKTLILRYRQSQVTPPTEPDLGGRR